MSWKRGVRKFELPEPDRLAFSHPYPIPEGSYEAAIAGFERFLRGKEPRITREELADGWRRDYSHRLAQGANEGSYVPYSSYEYRISIFLQWTAKIELHPLHAGYPELVAYRNYTKGRALVTTKLTSPLQPNSPDEEKSRRPAPGTVLGHLVAVTHFYDYVVDILGLKLRNPARTVMQEWKELMDKAPPRPRRRTPSIQEAIKIIAACRNLRDAMGFSTLLGTGARNTEFRLIKDTDVYLDERWIRLTPILGGKRVGPAWDKRDAPKPVDNSFWLPITREQARVIEWWQDEKPDTPYRGSPYLYPSIPRGPYVERPISAKALNDAFQAAVRASGLTVDWLDPSDRFVLHCLRHGYTTILEDATRGEDGEARFKDMIDALRGDSDRRKRSANTYRHFKPHQLQQFVDDHFPHLRLHALLRGLRRERGGNIWDEVRSMKP